jgi:hypothetical protein
MSVKRAAKFIKSALVGKKSAYYTSKHTGELTEKTKGGLRDVNLKRGGRTKSTGRAKVTSEKRGTKYGITPSGVRIRGSTPAERARAKKPARKVGLRVKGKPQRKT